MNEENNAPSMPDQPQQFQPNQPSKQPESSPVTPQFSPPTGKKADKKLLIILLVILVLLAGGAAAYWFLIRDDKKSTNSNNNQNQQTNQTEETDSIQALGVPDTVSYAFRSSSAVPYGVFWRPAAGGDRTEVGPLGAKSFLTQSAAHKNQVVYATDNESGGQAEKAIWHSSDAGKTFSKLYELTDAAQVTSLIFSVDGTKVVAAVLPAAAGKNEVMEIDISTKQATNLYTSEKAGVFLEAYSAVTDQLLFFEGCYNCDGNYSVQLVRRNTSTNQNSVVMDAGEGMFGTLVVRSDLKEAVAVSSGVSTAGLVPGGPSAPYAVKKINLESGEETTIATVAEEKLVLTGYMADGKTPYYTTDGQVYAAKSSTPELLYETARKLHTVYYVSDANVISAGGELTNYILDNFDVAAKKSTEILQGDAQTIVFGITTK